MRLPGRLGLCLRVTPRNGPSLFMCSSPPMRRISPVILNANLGRSRFISLTSPPSLLMMMPNLVQLQKCGHLNVVRLANLGTVLGEGSAVSVCDSRRVCPGWWRCLQSTNSLIGQSHAGLMVTCLELGEDVFEDCSQFDWESFSCLWAGVDT